MGREEHCKQTSLACVGSVWATLGLPQQVALQGSCLKRALGCVHFPGLSRSGSGSRVPHKGADSVGPAFCALPRSSSSGDQVLGRCTLPGAVRLITSPVPAARFPGRAGSGVPCVSSGETVGETDLWLQPSQWMSAVQDPRKTWLATGSLLAVCRPPACLPVCLQRGMGRSTASLLSSGIHSVLCSVSSWQCLRLGLFSRRFSLSLSGYPTVWVAISHYLPQIALRAFRPVLTLSKAATPPCSAPPWWWGCLFWCLRQVQVLLKNVIVRD